MTNSQATPSKPKAKSSIVESEELLGQELFLYDETTGAVHTLNGGAAMVWLLCDGTQDMEQISREIASSNGMSWEEMLPQVQETVGGFQELGLLEG